MVALRSLSDESAGAELRRQVERAEWQREYRRRDRDSNVCSVCGYTREFCSCPDLRENYGTDDSGIEVGVE